MEGVQSMPVTVLLDCLRRQCEESGKPLRLLSAALPRLEAAAGRALYLVESSEAMTVGNSVVVFYNPRCWPPSGYAGQEPSSGGNDR